VLLLIARRSINTTTQTEATAGFQDELACMRRQLTTLLEEMQELNRERSSRRSRSRSRSMNRGLVGAAKAALLHPSQPTSRREPPASHMSAGVARSLVSVDASFYTANSQQMPHGTPHRFVVHSIRSLRRRRPASDHRVSYNFGRNPIWVQRDAADLYPHIDAISEMSDEL
jgi:hypothetical protein